MEWFVKSVCIDTLQCYNQLFICYTTYSLANYFISCSQQKAELIKSVDGIICFKIVSALDQELKQAWVLDLKQGDFKDGIGMTIF